MGQGLLLHGAGHGGGLHGVPFHEFHPGGGVVEQVPHHDVGARGAAGGLAFQQLAGLQVQTGALVLAVGAGEQVDPAHGGGGGQGLAPEAQGADGLQILFTAELGGGVAQEGGFGVFPGHAAAVVPDPEQGHAPVLDLHGDGLRAGVDGIFHQLLDHGGGAFHHLACGDEVGKMGIQLYDLLHGITPLKHTDSALRTDPHSMRPCRSRDSRLMVLCRRMEVQMVPLRS